jgi:hypothetical protein
VLKKGGVGSITLESGTGHCDVWGVAGCGDDGDGMSLPFSFPPQTKTTLREDKFGVLRDLGRADKKQGRISRK